MTPPHVPSPKAIQEPVADGPAVRPYGKGQIGGVRAPISREAFKARRAALTEESEQPKEAVKVVLGCEKLAEAQQVVTNLQHQQTDTSVKALKEAGEGRKEREDNEVPPMVLDSRLLEPTGPTNSQSETTIQSNPVNNSSVTSFQHPPPETPQPMDSTCTEEAEVGYAARSPMSQEWQVPRRGPYRRSVPRNSANSELSELPSMKTEAPEPRQADTELLPVFDSLRVDLRKEDHALERSDE